jgi:hypothetical protein
MLNSVGIVFDTISDLLLSLSEMVFMSIESDDVILITN